MPAMLVMSSDGAPLSKAAECRRLMSPLNFDTYLLSASPPGFEVTAAKYLQCSSVTSPSFSASSFSASSYSESKLDGRRKRFFQSSVRITNDEQMTSLEVGREHRKSMTETSFYNTVVTNSELGIPGLDLLAVAYSDVTCCSLRQSKTEPDLNRKYKSGHKKVWFADDMGHALEHVRVFDESPDTPPKIDLDVIMHYERLAADDGCHVELVVETSMPFDNRAMLTERVNTSLVSLESLRVAANRSETGYQLIGTVLVKNVTFEKSVFVRCTFDDWLSSCDVTACFVRSESATWRSKGCVYFGMSSAVAAPCLDVFEFRVTVPLQTSQTSAVQLAVCFQFLEDGERKEKWDNCDGLNYRLQLRRKKIAEDVPIVSSLKHDHEEDVEKDLKGPYW